MKVGTGCQRGTRASTRLAWTAALQAHAGEGNDDEVLGCQLGFMKKTGHGVGKTGRTKERRAAQSELGRCGGADQQAKSKGGRRKFLSIFQTNFQTTFECKFKSI